MALRPVPLGVAPLADPLETMAHAVRVGDCLEGNISWELGYPETDVPGAEPPCGPHERMVSGVWRTGNLRGQGGMQMLGRQEPD